ncbi:MAG TPA: hypothetical protein VEZ72_18845, partial [Paenibacillus sp.]|nr:hypothetical protein [Paenibacillus sp.]
MSVLIGMREGETLARLLAALPQRRERRALAQEGGAFFDAAREPFETIALHMELVADRYPWEWISPLRALRPESRIVVVPSEEAYDSLWLEAAERLALEAGFEWVPLGAGPEEIAATVLGRGGTDPAEPGSRGVVAALWSAACKDGATTVAANVAVTLAREAPALRVGLLDLNLKNPELRVMLRGPDGGRTNATLRPKLQTGALTPA